MQNGSRGMTAGMMHNAREWIKMLTMNFTDAFSGDMMDLWRRTAQTVPGMGAREASASARTCRNSFTCCSSQQEFR